MYLEAWMDPAWSGSSASSGAELCRSCVPPDHQLSSLLQNIAWLLYLNCNCCSQFPYHHVITQITVSHFVSNNFFMKNSTPCNPPPPPPPPPPPSKSIPVWRKTNRIERQKFPPTSLNISHHNLILWNAYGNLHYNILSTPADSLLHYAPQVFSLWSLWNPG
jgi:hypothetical protein